MVTNGFLRRRPGNRRLYLWKVEFPVYRKYANGKSVFKIMSETSALELQLLGTRCLRHAIEATILPERQLIRDLLDLAFPGILVSDEEEFEATLEKCRLQDSSEN